jgi:hypothetical protein
MTLTFTTDPQPPPVDTRNLQRAADLIDSGLTQLCHVHGLVSGRAIEDLNLALAFVRQAMEARS